MAHGFNFSKNFMATAKTQYALWRGVGCALVGVGLLPAALGQVKSDPGIHINGHASGNCVTIGDPTETLLNASWTLIAQDTIKFNNPDTKCNSSRKDFQRDSVLFYNPSGTGATSLTLGGELYVNEGFLGLANRNANGRDHWNSMRIGDATTTAVGSHAIAIGVGASADSGGAVALGRGASVPAEGLNSGVAIGAGTTAIDASIALGAETRAGSLAADGNPRVGYAVAIGWRTLATGERAIAVGSQSRATREGSLAVGRASYADGKNSIALGRSINVTGEEGIGIGTGTRVSAMGAIAIGKGASSEHADSVALGADSRSEAVNTVAAVELNGTTYTPNTSLTGSTVSMGSLAKNRQIQHVGPGAVHATSTDVVVGQQLHAAYTEINKLGEKDRQHDARDAAQQMQIDELLARPVGGVGDVASIAQAIGVDVSPDGKLAMPSLDLKSPGGGVSYEPNLVGAIQALDAQLIMNDEALGVLGSAMVGISNDVADNVAAVEANAAALQTLTNQIHQGEIGLVQQDATTRTLTVGKDTGGASVDLTGTDGVRTAMGLKDARLAGDSTEAVTGAQLHATNEKLTGVDARVTQNSTDIGTNTRDIAEIQAATQKNADDLARLDGRMTQTASDLAETRAAATQTAEAITALDAQVAKNAADIARNTATITEGQAATTKNAQDIASVASDITLVQAVADQNARDLTALDGRVQQSAADITKNADDIMALANRVAQTAGDVVSNAKGVEANAAALQTLTNQIHQGEIGLVQQDATTRTLTVGKDTGGASVDLTGTDGVRTAMGLKDARLAGDSTEAVTGAQLHATNEKLTGVEARVTQNSEDIASNTKDIADNRTVTQKNAEELSALDARMTRNTADIAKNTQDIASTASDVTKAQAVADQNARDLTALDGRVHQSTADIAKNADDIMTLQGESAKQAIDIAANTAAAQKNAQDIASLDNRVTDNTGHIAQNARDIVENLRATEENARGLAALDAVVAQNTTDIAGTKADTEKNARDILSLDGRVVQNTNDVARNTTDIATNAEQIGRVDERVKGNSVSLAVLEGLATEQKAAIDEMRRTNSYVAVDPGGNGDGSPASVVPGSRGVAMGSNAQASGNNSMALGVDAEAQADGSVALGAGAVATRENTVSVGTPGAERQIVNVAAGVEETDAVNLGQAHQISRQAVGQAVQQANNYTDQRINAVRREAHAGTALAMAMAGLPQSGAPGKKMLALSLGTYKGQSAVAIGLSKVNDRGNRYYRATMSSTSNGDVGASAGVGFQW